MRITRNTWWLTITKPIVGFDEGGEGEGPGEGEGQGTPGEDSGEGRGDSGGAGEGDAGKDDTSGLKSALEKERADRKKLEKELSTFRKAQQTATDAEKSEVDRLKGENERTAAKATKLAQGFRQNAIETAVLKAAGVAKFRDPSDALRTEVMAAIGVEQDEDDPTKVEIDEATVTEAIKKLAKSKPHYIATDAPRPPKSGSSFSGGGTSPKGDAVTDELKRKYPALRGL